MDSTKSGNHYMDRNTKFFFVFLTKLHLTSFILLEISYDSPKTFNHFLVINQGEPLNGQIRVYFCGSSKCERKVRLDHLYDVKVKVYMYIQ